MILLLLAYLGGVLTIVSPCILPVLPFVFARADRPFLRSGLPMLVGMALTFAAVATLAAVTGGWAVEANQYGRLAALTLLALFGVTLLLPELSDRLMRPLVALGASLSQSADRSAATSGATILPSLLLGVATGLLWAPCAGPVLGLILTGAALQGASLQTSVLLLAYAAGAATSSATVSGLTASGASSAVTSCKAASMSTVSPTGRSPSEVVTVFGPSYYVLRQLLVASAEHHQHQLGQAQVHQADQRHHEHQERQHYRGVRAHLFAVRPDDLAQLGDDLPQVGEDIDNRVARRLA